MTLTHLGRLLLIACLFCAKTLPSDGAESSGGKAKMSPPSSLATELAHYEALPSTTSVRVQLSRLHFYLGHEKQSVSGLSTDERASHFAKGKALAENVLIESPRDPGGLLWWSANAGGLADLHRGLGSLSVIREVRDALLKLKAVDPRYGYAAWARALGAVYHAAPGLISIGSDHKAEECLREALKAFPDFPGNRLVLARFLWDKDRREEAAELARSAARTLASSPDFGEFTPDRSTWEETLALILPAGEGKRP